MSVFEISLSGGGDAVVLVVDESVCGVNLVLVAGELDVWWRQRSVLLGW